MGRIPQGELEQLKREAPLAALVEAHGVKLSRHGKDLVGLCPFHDDKNPSLVVSPSKNLWHCLGACQTGGSAIDWVMKTEGVSFRHAVELLREGAFAVSSSSRPPTRSQAEKLPPLVELSASDQELLDDVCGYYHATLKESAEAQAYLEKRGLYSGELVERFKLGFANRTLAYRLPARGRKAGDEVRTRLQQLGILRESGHEHMNGCLVVPIVDENGRILSMYGRKITQGLKKGLAQHLYLPGRRRGVFNPEALKGSREIVLCESLIDALTFWAYGFRHVTTSYGVEGFSEEHLEAFKRHGTERVFIAYDRDEAGDKAATKLAEKLIAEGLECFRVELPKGMDVNEYALKVKPAERSLMLALNKSTWLGKGERPEPLTTTAPLPLAAEEPPASPQAQARAPQEELAAEVSDDEVRVALGERSYRVRGLSRNTAFDVLKVNVLVSREDAFFVDTLDVYSAKQRTAFQKAAAAELSVSDDVIKRELGRLLLFLEDLQERRIKGLIEPEDETPAMTDEEEQEALALLRDPHLTEHILDDFARLGIVGEETNKLTGYLAALSRKLEEPLAVLVQSSSAAGKSSLMEAVLALVPEEERVKYSAMTGQSLFYMGETDLAHKVLAIVEEEGASRASYALKLLQSEGELSIASTGKDPVTGKLTTHEYRVKGPVMIFLTTTAIEIDEELLNRCLVLSVDEGRAQTRAIHELQRRAQTLPGLLERRERERIRRLHQNAQRLIEPLLVTNPFAEELTFLDDKTRTRRDHMKYLTLIRSIALLHQHQRERKTVQHRGEQLEYIEATAADVALANRLCHEVLGRTLDELPPQTRRLLHLVEEHVAARARDEGIERKEARFSRRELREAFGWGDTQLKVHLGRLVELEYVVAHQERGSRRLAYELVYEGQGKDGRPFVLGLVDEEKLGTLRYDGERSGLNGHRSGHGRPPVGASSAGGRTLDITRKLKEQAPLAADERSSSRNALLLDEEAPSYVPVAEAS